jgi:hypothetical protein
LAWPNPIAAATSAGEAQQTIAAGCRSKSPFHSDRAVSYPGFPGVITAPEIVERRASMPPPAAWVMARLLFLIRVACPRPQEVQG